MHSKKTVVLSGHGLLFHPQGGEFETVWSDVCERFHRRRDVITIIPTFNGVRSLRSELQLARAPEERGTLEEIHEELTSGDREFSAVRRTGDEWLPDIYVRREELTRADIETTLASYLQREEGVRCPAGLKFRWRTTKLVVTETLVA